MCYTSWNAKIGQIDQASTPSPCTIYLDVNGDSLPKIGKLESHLNEGIRTQVILLWHIFSKIREHENIHIQVVYHSERKQEVAWNIWRGQIEMVIILSTMHTHTYMFIFCLAFSMSLLTSGVMLKRSFWGIIKGTMGERTISVFCLWHKKKDDQSFPVHLKMNE